MKKYFDLSMFTVVMAAVVTLLAGCAGTPVYYHDVEASLTPQPGKGLVIFYFKREMLTRNARCQVYVNGQGVQGELRRGLFCTYQADPGKLRITTTQSSGPAHAGDVAKKQPSLDVVAGQTYYVDMNLGFLGGNEKLRVVSQERAVRELKDCKWVNAGS